ncbi:MAG TPA: methyltransferase domain-containing protein [Methanospirillum sp.]|uniref:methyltransferase domain-containing protein n=1 Tax=Methanospirillum sp. TaxID=45200 RepID=UPI002BBB4C3C|nr:methyltransferase domain-containing protein [Methanospirillum sp.]HWQ62820.1 methyltransferase domain-containing protein [Methanospirillum sp.]
MSQSAYVHGYSDREAERLSDQANTLTEILHHDTRFPPGSLVLEAGCGTGAQTVIITSQNPDCRFRSIDISQTSLDFAEERLRKEAGSCISQVTFEQGDIRNLPYDDETFDHIFLCFVLEHLPEPGNALKELKRVLKFGGSIMAIEGDHGSVYFYPPSQAAIDAVQTQIELQHRSGGDACIGRRLYPLLTETGFSDVRVTPRMVYVDASKPELVDGFTRKTFTAMIEGVQHNAVAAGLISNERFEEGIQSLYRTCEPEGVFCYTFFKAAGVKS